MNTIIINPPELPQAAVIWLHGLGADGHDFESIVPLLPPELIKSTKFIFPHAPTRPITINGGMVMRGWYDIMSMDLTQNQDAAGIKASEQIICNLIAEQHESGIEKIILAGFSQGGAIALHTGLRYPRPLSGIMALSTYVPLANTLMDERHISNQNTPIFYAHGEYDPVIPLTHAQHSYTLLNKLGYAVSWHTYVMEHSVYPEEITDIGQWLLKCLA